MELAQQCQSNVFDKKERILITVFCISVFFINWQPQYQTIVKYTLIPICLLMLLNTDSFDFMIFPLLFLDDTINTYVAGRITLIWFYFLLFLIKHIHYLFVNRNSDLIQISKQELLLIALIVEFVVFGYFQRGMVYIKCLFAFVCALVCKRNVEELENVKRLQFIIIASALITAISAINGLGGKIDYFNRSIGFGFSDPNYTSSLCCIAFASSLYNIDDNINNYLRIVCVFIFLIAIIVTASLSGIIVAIGLIMFRILSEEKTDKRIRNIASIIGVAILLILVVFPNNDLDFLGSITARIKAIFGGAQISASEITTGRTGIAVRYLKYYIEQNPIRIVFGGNVINTASFFSRFGGTIATHNVYLDHLFSLGAFGMTVLLIAYFSRFRELVAKDRSKKHSIMIAAVKISLFVFGITLSYLDLPLWWFIALI